MNIREKAFDLQKVYAEMSEAFSGFQRASGLSCMPGCGKCCHNPEVEASILEMIPWAAKVYDEDRIDEWLERLSRSEQGYCHLLVNEKCSSYSERPAVCRMFGVSGYFDKHHRKILSVCKYLREAHPEKLPALENIKESSPDCGSWNTKLSSISPSEFAKKYPINEAMFLARQKVSYLLHYEDNAQRHAD